MPMRPPLPAAERVRVLDLNQIIASREPTTILGAEHERRHGVLAVKGKKIRYRLPHIIEITIPPLGLDPQTSREIVNFHRSRKIQVRFGHAIKNVCRWCFSDAATANAFKKQFGGYYVVKSKKTRPSGQATHA
jgi:hypothetical protein